MPNEDNPMKFKIDILQYKKPELVFYFDLDAIAGENEEYEFVWEKIERAIISFLYSLAKSNNKAIVDQQFFIWGKFGSTVNIDEHLCNAYFIYLIPETELMDIAKLLAESFKTSKISWGFEASGLLDEECIPLFKYERGNIIRYIFDQITEDGLEDFGCAKLEFTPWDGDWHISSGAYSIDMTNDTTLYKLSEDKQVRIIYRKFNIEV
ncbi:MAG: hypothetical protein N3A72_06305 [bacterium]|nr:hypothetical protein [bacterium]